MPVDSGASGSCRSISVAAGTPPTASRRPASTATARTPDGRGRRATTAMLAGLVASMTTSSPAPPAARTT
ncbi:MAG: hypothetical protein IPH09_13280 [bacterium]|nr:hypothetical protein [bacterium]